MATHPYARTAVRAQSTGGGSDPPKLLARWTVGGEERWGRWGEEGGWVPSFMGPHLCPLPPCCLHLLGQIPYSGGNSDLSCHLLTPLYSSRDYFLSTPDMSGTINRTLQGPSSTHTSALHISLHLISPTGFLLFSRLNPLHLLFPPILMPLPPLPTLDSLFLVQLSCHLCPGSPS